MNTCCVCLDHSGPVVFQCSTIACAYHLCADCVNLAIDHGNARHCPYCRRPTARDMLESVYGVRAVEEMEHLVRQEGRDERLCGAPVATSRCVARGRSVLDHVRFLVNTLTEQLNLRCPRCQKVFDDYDGCNALRCGCGAAFCAVCLQDCGTDAHEHIRTHGDMYEKNLFQQAKLQRERATIQQFFETLAQESYDVQELVRRECDKTFSSATLRSAVADYDSLRKQNWDAALGKELFSVLVDGLKGPITSDDIAPRCAVSTDCNVWLESDGCGSTVCQVIVQHRQGSESVSLSPQQFAAIKSVCSCAVVAFAGAGLLYGTRPVAPPPDRPLRANEVALLFVPILGDGRPIRSSGRTLTEIGCRRRPILGIDTSQMYLSLALEWAEREEDHKEYKGDVERTMEHLSSFAWRHLEMAWLWFTRLRLPKRRSLGVPAAAMVLLVGIWVLALWYQPWASRSWENSVLSDSSLGHDGPWTRMKSGRLVYCVTK